jgi:hypothetical protein
MSYLRDLALGRGQSFAYPQTFDDADREIKRLLAAKRTSSADRRRERRALGRDMAEGQGDAASVRRSELSGYGSSATWSRRS